MSTSRRVFLHQTAALGAFASLSRTHTADTLASPPAINSSPKKDFPASLDDPDKRASAREFLGSYTGEGLQHLVFPLGGLGGGMIGFAGNGSWQDVSLWHHPQLGHAPVTFATLHITDETGPVIRLLEGPSPRAWHFAGSHPLGGLQGTLPRFPEAEFTARFPFATLELRDAELPWLEATITAWSPFIPGDADASSLPVAGFEYTLVNRGDTPRRVTFGWHTENLLKTGAPVSTQEIVALPGGLGLRANRRTANRELPGALDAMLGVSQTTVDACWFRGSFFDARTLLWEDIRHGRQPSRAGVGPTRPASGGSLGTSTELAPGQRWTIPLRLAWHVPASDLRSGPPPSANEAGAANTHRPWVASHFANVSALSAHWEKHYDSLRMRSAAFRDALHGPGLPPEVVEAVAANLTILRSPTMLRQSDGRLWAWEGTGRTKGNWPGTCTHVWGYAQAVAHLFPELERAQREVEFLVNQDSVGHQTFRTALPIRPPAHDFHAAADGQLGAIVRVHRDWKLDGDIAWLRRLWPAVRQSLEWSVSTWDPRETGLPEEPHHNTYDIEFWGPDPLCSSLYLAALAAVAAMGRALGEPTARYEQLLERGRKRFEGSLFNGDWFTQQIMTRGLDADPTKPDPKAIDKQELSPEAAAYLAAHGPRHQIGGGVLADGVFGCWQARLAGLDSIIDPAKERSHLRSIVRHNFLHSFCGRVCPQRWHYAADDEAGLLLSSWPNGDRPPLPFVYSDEVWTGIEYAVASHLLLLGETEDGLRIVRAARSRYDGRWRNPFAEEEAGLWYGRALSSYALLPALTGIRYEPESETLVIAPTGLGDFAALFTADGAWGVAGVRESQPFAEVREGQLPLRYLRLEHRDAPPPVVVPIPAPAT